ncbi:MAG: SDR family NAD(P)-dependent oxidoreductase [Pseudomonadota bacterium]
MVTGANRGIGRNIAQTLAREGANVIVNYRRNEVQAEEVVAGIERQGCKVMAVRADTSMVEDLRVMMNRIIELFNKIDILGNNAGIFSRSNFL